METKILRGGGGFVQFSYFLYVFIVYSKLYSHLLFILIA